jgi:hypothetical protein
MGRNKNRRQPADRSPQQRDTAAGPSGDRVDSPSVREPAQPPRGKRQKRFGHN